MSMFDLVIRGGTVGSVSGVFEADIGIVGEEIAALGRGLPAGRSEIDAAGRLVLPGGVDSHCHIEQLSGGGLMNRFTKRITHNTKMAIPSGRWIETRSS